MEVWASNAAIFLVCIEIKAYIAKLQFIFGSLRFDFCGISEAIIDTNFYIVAASCDRGEYSCPSNYHLAEKVINPCCKTAVCECNACEEPAACKEGWRASDTTDECGCVTRECSPPTECLYNGDAHAPGESQK